jgi:hypothetical protein
MPKNNNFKERRAALLEKARRKDIHPGDPYANNANVSKQDRQENTPPVDEKADEPTTYGRYEVGQEAKTTPIAPAATVAPKNKRKRVTMKTVARELLREHFPDARQVELVGPVAQVITPDGAKTVTVLPPALSMAAQMRDSWERGRLKHVLLEIAEGRRRANREQMEAIKIILDRGWGRAPETHFVASVGPEAAEAVGALTREQLLGVLDAGITAGQNRPVLDSPPTTEAKPSEPLEPSDA